MARRLLVVELDALGFLQAERAGTSYLEEGDYISRFLEFVLQEQNFRELVWVEASQPWWSILLGRGGTPCRIERSLEAARRSRDDLGRACMKGWQLLFVVNKALLETTEFLATAQYRVVTKTDLGSGKAGDILPHFPTRSRVTECLQSLQVDSNQTVVLFAHDADPVFLIAQQES